MLLFQTQSDPVAKLTGAETLSPLPTTSANFVQLRDVYKSYGKNLVVMDRMSLDM
ncbi:MAG: hypothetical protein CPDRYMAC_4724 [uncultured Paraburkholderia sp.]|nr:MAG: hypothetical protein CPDRYDRY_4638 [uncultured Paraburkholderia sp.]CAH2937883.1 MAG: hypothetical protein CPDRYMAC_4724 [uncultured Paraburkholderia sp.]